MTMIWMMITVLPLQNWNLLMAIDKEIDSLPAELWYNLLKFEGPNCVIFVKFNHYKNNLAHILHALFPW